MSSTDKQRQAKIRSAFWQLGNTLRKIDVDEEDMLLVKALAGDLVGNMGIKLKDIRFKKYGDQASQR